MARKTDDEIVTSSAAEVMKPEFTITDEMLNGVDDFDTLMRMAEEVHGTVETARAVRIAGEAEKAKLVGVPLLLVEWHFITSEKFGETREYVEILCATKNADGSTDKWKVTDGSTGILAQLRAYTLKTERTGGVFVPQGIRVSEYPIDPTTRQPLTRQAKEQYDSRGMSYPTARTYYVDL